LYVTRPVGVTDQPDFHNAVVALDIASARSASVESAALDLLERLKDLERQSGRRKRRRWGPRELDLDLLVFGRARIDVERSPEAQSLDPRRGTGAQRLVVPHRSARERLFVLAPLADLAPGLVPPGWAETVESARRRQVSLEGPDAVRPEARWDVAAADWRPIQPR
jgi:2-amino-4-hydroxy-6-hydroxymethyldihydropteridine diphosphokinase